MTVMVIDTVAPPCICHNVKDVMPCISLHQYGSPLCCSSLPWSGAAAICALHSAFFESIGGGVQGWSWVDEGRNGRHKFGYITEEADHDIIFVVSPSVSAQILQAMHQLFSHGKMW